MPAPLPPDEEKRLQTLARYDVLDTPPDAALDRLTALAARIFGVPIALVSLVDRDRQWFKSRHGLELCGTHRDQSFCAHAILPHADGPLVVPDATRDPRFADNPLVTGPPGIRFYAGAPLRMANGTALGSFCIIDTRSHAQSFPKSRSRHVAPTSPPRPSTPSNCTPPASLAREDAAERGVDRGTPCAESEGRLRQPGRQHPRHDLPVRAQPGRQRSIFPFIGEGCREFYGVEPQAIYERPELVLDVLDPKRSANAFMASLHEIGPHARTAGTAPAPTARPTARSGTGWRALSRPEVDLRRPVSLERDDHRRDLAQAGRARGRRSAARRVRTVLESITNAFYSLDRDVAVYLRQRPGRAAARTPRRRPARPAASGTVLPHKAGTGLPPAFPSRGRDGRAGGRSRFIPRRSKNGSTCTPILPRKGFPFTARRSPRACTAQRAVARTSHHLLQRHHRRHG